MLILGEMCITDMKIMSQKKSTLNLCIQNNIFLFGLFYDRWPVSRASTSCGVFTSNEEENGAMFARLLNKRRR